MKPIAELDRQRGAALFMVLIILVAMAWFALSGFRISGQHLQIVGNDQARVQAEAAAQRAIEQTLSSDAFAKNPGAVAAVPIHTDIDGDGHDDFVAMLTPAPKCFRVRPIKTSEFPMPLSDGDKKCLVSTDSNDQYDEHPGGASPSGNSYCASSEWNVSATVTDTQSGASVALGQGVAIRVKKSDAMSFCK
jgi:hypothetical protein